MHINTHAMGVVSAAATQDLWVGIMTSQPKLVQSAISRGANFATRAGTYEDTPLIAAVRVYGNSLVGQLKGTGKEFGKRLTRAILGSTIISCVSYFIAQRSTDAAIYSWLASFSLLLALPRSFFSTIPAEVKVIELILNNSSVQDIHQRNKEGLTALEVLGSFHAYAYELQDSFWERLMNYLIQLSTDPTIKYEPLHDIQDSLQSLRLIS